ncbi:hypothetical protein PVAND_014540 [Polypedilum vanderplanki]|uniref:Uncharacterized protein n=1 Tax=Polypedilum vanderplanki TaxID=319348 RepID=A0A9J6BA24_POLVA|nr:hypothetical protein PVAND_014540 [Polypedilum vanderplanki]
MVLVSKFLCCFDLETGAYFVGWFGIIVSLLSIISTVLIGIPEINKCEIAHNCFVIYGFFIAIELLFLLLLLIDLTLILGTKTRNSKRMLPALVFHGINILASIILIGLAMIIKAIFHSILYFVMFIVNGYIFLVIFALYRKFKKEFLIKRRRFVQTRL